MSNRQFLSTKLIEPRDRLIVALDVPNADAAIDLVNRLGESVTFYKLGLELFMAGGYFELMDRLHGLGKKVFVDLKFFDVPDTVAAAVRQVRNHHAEFVTVHAQDEALRRAVQEKNGVKVLAVTVLTSLDNADMEALGFQVPIKDVVLSRARRALDVGCDGVISSGLESADLRREYRERFLIVVPGIRPGKNDRAEADVWESGDDQKRTVDVEKAFRNGADYIVVGRPIRKAPDPRVEAESIQATIAAIFSGT